MDICIISDQVGLQSFSRDNFLVYSKSNQFNQSHIANDIVALMLTLSVNRPLAVCMEISLSIDHLL